MGLFDKHDRWEDRRRQVENRLPIWASQKEIDKAVAELEKGGDVEW